MPSALLGAVSCFRCGQAFHTADPYCSSCGVRLVEPATGSVLGSYSGMLGGVSRVRPLRGRLALAVDLIPVVALLVLIGVQLDGHLGGPVGVVWSAPVLAGYLAFEVVALARAGR